MPSDALRRLSAVLLAACLLAASPAPAPSQEPARLAAERFEAYIAGQRSRVKNEDNLPFLLTHGRKTARAILMVHGLSDSPYYMRALAETFHEAGYNVAAILLPGHGTRAEDLLKARLREWRAEVAMGLETAGHLGEEVHLAGFSAGGALVLDALARNYGDPHPRPIRGLYLFSPALQIANKLAPVACNLPLLDRYKPWGDDDPQTPEDNPYRYNKIALNAACQLYRLTQDNARRRSEISAALAAHRVAVFAVQSEADATVRTPPVIAFMNLLPRQVRREFILYPKSAAVKHSAVTRPETNPYYAELADRLKAFAAIDGAFVRGSEAAAPAPIRKPGAAPRLESLLMPADPVAAGWDGR